MDMPNFDASAFHGSSVPMTHALLSIVDAQAEPYAVEAFMVVPSNFTVREVLTCMQDAGFRMTCHCQIVKYDVSGYPPGKVYVPYIKVPG